MSSQQRSTPQDGAKLIWRAVVAAGFAGFVCAAAICQVLMDLKLGPGQVVTLVGFVLFTSACLTLTTYFLTRAPLNSRE
jgi:hypothetical protein